MDHFSQKEMMERIMEKLEETHDTLIKHIAQEDAHLSEIKTHVQRTNGRVTKLEEDIDSIQMKTENLGVKVAAGVFIATVVTAELVRVML